MPVEHIVLCKFARMPTPAECSQILSLGRIPGVIDLSAGENYTARGQGFNYGIVVRFESREAEEAYQTHADHVRVRDGVLKPLLDTTAAAPILAMDYEHAETSES